MLSFEVFLFSIMLLSRVNSLEILMKDSFFLVKLLVMLRIREESVFRVYLSSILLFKIQIKIG